MVADFNLSANLPLTAIDTRRARVVASVTIVAVALVAMAAIASLFSRP